MKNQTTLSASLVAQAGLVAGYRLEWSFGKNRELLAEPVQPFEQLVKSLRGRGRRLLPKGRSAVADWIQDCFNEA